MTLLPSYSQIAESLKKGDTLETQEQIMRLCEAALELQEENLALREEIKKLREENGIAGSVEFFEGVYWLVRDDERVGPYCPRCYDECGRLATLLDGSRYVAKTRWICPVCNRVFDSDT